MPLAVTHILVALFFVDLYRKYVLKRKDFPLWLVLVGGIAGLLPDLDYAAYWVLQLFYPIDLSQIHGLYTHTFLIPAVLLLIALCFVKYKKIFHVLVITGMGYTIHLLLDGIFEEAKPLLLPFSSAKLGLGLVPESMMVSVFISMDAVLLVAWLIWEWKTKRIKEFT